MSATLEVYCPTKCSHVTVQIRDYNGIERDYQHVDNLTIEAAETLVGNLKACILVAKSNKRASDEERIESLRKEIECKRRELEVLERGYNTEDRPSPPIGGPAETKPVK